MSTATATKIDTLLNPMHLEHLTKEGFTLDQIKTLEEAGVRSMGQREAQMKNLKVWNEGNGGWDKSSGLYFPFTSTFGQLRCDTPLIRENGKPCKYLTPVKADTQAHIPEGCKAITEGAKDGWRGTLAGGVPTGFVAGVSHIAKALPAGCGHTIIFDSDGWRNPQVCQALLKASIHCKGRIQLVPEIPGEPKGGLCEYFNAGHTADDYKQLLKDAMWPGEFLLKWSEKWEHFEDATLKAECVRITVKYMQRLAK